jgi:hypothetical protein
MQTIKIDLEDGIPTITDMPKGVKIVIRNIDQDSDTVDVVETTHQIIAGDIKQTKVKEYDLPDLG